MISVQAGVVLLSCAVLGHVKPSDPASPPGPRASRVICQSEATEIECSITLLGDEGFMLSSRSVPALLEAMSILEDWPACAVGGCVFGAAEAMPAAVESNGRHCLAHVRTVRFEMVPGHDEEGAGDKPEAGAVPPACEGEAGATELCMGIARYPVIAVHRVGDRKTDGGSDGIRMQRLGVTWSVPAGAQAQRLSNDRAVRQMGAGPEGAAGPGRGVEAGDHRTEVPSFPTWFLMDPLGRQIIEELVKPEHIVVLYEGPEDARRVAARIDLLRERRPRVAVSGLRGRSGGK